MIHLVNYTASVVNTSRTFSFTEWTKKKTLSFRSHLKTCPEVRPTYPAWLTGALQIKENQMFKCLFTNIIYYYLLWIVLTLRILPLIFAEVPPWSLHLRSPGEDRRLHIPPCFGSMSRRKSRGVELKREESQSCDGRWIQVAFYILLNVMCPAV